LSDSALTVGIIANPASGRDIRRLVCHASVFAAVEKANMVQRILGALGALDIERVLMMPDQSGISAGVLRARERLPASPGIRWPRLEILDMPNEGSARDTVVAVEQMTDEGASTIIVLGGDGTNRVVAARCGKVPLATLSTGTNNVFPDLREATVTGMAAALVARRSVPEDVALRRNKVLRVISTAADRPAEIALVDACVSSLSLAGARALWRPETLSELAVTFAEADAIGLSSIAGMLQPVSRDHPQGLYLRLVAPRSARARTTVTAAIAPGLVAEIGVACIEPLMPGQWTTLQSDRGTIALDGEREIEFSEGEQFAVMLDLSGPRTIDVSRTLAWAAQNGTLRVDNRAT
jgi:predicted polyphosphate/ATP-dependent NAD kinase